MIPMPQLSSPDVFTQLDQLARRFAHWRQHRPSPKARIPAELWDEAAALTTHLSVSRVAKHLGLCTTDLKKRCLGGCPRINLCSLLMPVRDTVHAY
jgi:hypothetical protein